MELRTDKEKLNTENTSSLFRSVSWGSSLTPEEMLLAVTASDHIVTAWEGDTLIGLVRSLDDGVWSANIDCMMVRRENQRQGVARAMLTKLLEQLGDIRYISASPNEKFILPLYTGLGFRLVEDGSLLQIDNTLTGGTHNES